jgi:hypothetical protein
LIASARIYAADSAKHTSAEVPAAPRLDDRYVAIAMALVSTSPDPNAIVANSSLA